MFTFFKSAVVAVMPAGILLLVATSNSLWASALIYIETDFKKSRLVPVVEILNLVILISLTKSCVVFSLVNRDEEAVGIFGVLMSTGVVTVVKLVEGMFKLVV